MVAAIFYDFFVDKFGLLSSKNYGRLKSLAGVGLAASGSRVQKLPPGDPNSFPFINITSIFGEYQDGTSKLSEDR